MMSLTASVYADWAPVEGTLTTRLAQQVSPEDALPEYPRLPGVNRMKCHSICCAAESLLADILVASLASERTK